MSKKLFISQPMNGLSDEQVLQERDATISKAKADVAVFAPGWQNARGCRIEHQCAEDYDIPMMEV